MGLNIFIEWHILLSVKLSIIFHYYISITGNNSNYKTYYKTMMLRLKPNINDYP